MYRRIVFTIPMSSPVVIAVASGVAVRACGVLHNIHHRGVIFFGMISTTEIAIVIRFPYYTRNTKKTTPSSLILFIDLRTTERQERVPLPFCVGIQQLSSPYNTTQHGVLISNVGTCSVHPFIIAGTIIGSAGGCIIHVNYTFIVAFGCEIKRTDSRFQHEHWMLVPFQYRARPHTN